MKTFGGHTRLASIVALITVLGAVGCLPIPHQVALSPPITGQVQRSDGTPVAGARVAVADALQDSTCANIAASTTTDSVGSFQLPATTRRVGVIWLAPHTPLSRFRVCVGTAGTFARVYEQDIWAYPARKRRLPRTLQCVEAPMPESQDSTRVTCSTGLRP